MPHGMKWIGEGDMTKKYIALRNNTQSIFRLDGNNSNLSSVTT